MYLGTCNRSGAPSLLRRALSAGKNLWCRADAIFRMLNFNEGLSNLKQRKISEEGSSPYKILVLDSFSKLIIAPLVSVQDLRQRGGVTLHLSIEASREPIPDVPAVYFVRATADNVQRLLQVSDLLTAGRACKS